jgi:ketosteroid isomerase-like protein
MPPNPGLMRLKSSLFAALAVVAACGSRSMAADADAISARSAAFSAAVVRASALGWADTVVRVLADFYSLETVVFPPRGEPLRGREALRRYWTRTPDRRILAHIVMPERVDVDQNLATEHGWFRVTSQRDSGNAVVDSARYVSIWKRDADGEWRKHLDNWW